MTVKWCVKLFLWINMKSIRPILFSSYQCWNEFYKPSLVHFSTLKEDITRIVELLNIINFGIIGNDFTTILCSTVQFLCMTLDVSSPGGFLVIRTSQYTELDKKPFTSWMMGYGVYKDNSDVHVSAVSLSCLYFSTTNKQFRIESDIVHINYLDIILSLGPSRWRPFIFWKAVLRARKEVSSVTLRNVSDTLSRRIYTALKRSVCSHHWINATDGDHVNH